jgi:hypothetical protein
MYLIDYHRLAVFEGRHPHQGNVAVYYFVSPTDPNVVLRVLVRMKEKTLRTSFDLMDSRGNRSDKRVTVRLKNGQTLAKIGYNEMGASELDDVRVFAEKEFELMDDAGVVIEMIAKSTKPSVLEELGFTKSSVARV